VNMLYL